MAGRLLVMALGAAVSGPLCAGPLADHTPLPQATEVPTATAAGNALERTLQVDTDAAQRDVDLLVHKRSAAGADLPPEAKQPPGSQVPAVASATRMPRAQAADNPAAGGVVADRAAIPEPVRDAVRFLRDHRFWLLGALGLFAAMVIGGPLWRRRRAGLSERRQRELAGQSRSSRGRRRSSRH